MNPLKLPPNTVLLERGWLSANTVLISDATGVTDAPNETIATIATNTHGATAIDTGYCTHALQTVALIEAALAGKRLDRVVNTHLHSDHCGGNAALVAHFGCEVLIPPGEAAAVAAWDTTALSYEPTGQECPRFAYTGLVQPSSVLRMGGMDWVALAAPGHDPNSLIFYCEAQRCLISADALWENGFGVVFPELDGMHAFDAVAATLDLIDTLAINLVLPGHGGAFGDVPGALARARMRLNGFVQNPSKHRWHAVKVLCMFWLMTQNRAACTQAVAHLAGTRYIQQVAAQLGGTAHAVVQHALDEMVGKRQLLIDGANYRVV